MSKRKRPRGIARTVRVHEEEAPRRKVLEALGLSRKPALVVLAGPELGERKTVDNDQFVIGRDLEANLVLTDPRVSFHHCRLEDRGDGWSVIDEGSTNGVRVNGERVQEKLLAPNDKIELGDTVLRFEIQDPEDRAYDEMVQRLMNIDDLTGLLVRRRFDRELDELLRVATSRDEPLGLLVMDLDGLKAINDAHGHLFGAFVIAESGRLIGRLLPSGGIAARFGGDEFVAALPSCDLPATATFAEAILAAVATHRYEREGRVLVPGISIGVASFPVHARDGTALFHRADEALYAAKRAGKRCVRTAE